MLKAAERYAIKELTGEVVAEVGGQEAAASVTRVKRHGTFGDYINDERYLVPLDVAIELDQYLLSRGKKALFAERYAQLTGHVLVRIDGRAGLDAITRRSSRSAEWFGKMMADILSAIADGRITGEEGTRILADIHQLMTELAGVAQAVRDAVEQEDSTRA